VIRHATRELERLEAQGAPTPQLGLFGEVVDAEAQAAAAAEISEAQEALQQALAALDPDTLSPREALEALYQLKKLQL
jgi:DNA mismatch repair protein MutS